METGTSSSSAPTVELRGVTKRFPLFSRRRERLLALLGADTALSHKTAVESVDLTVHAGEALGLIGENGSGKSTLLRMVAGILEPNSGTVRVATPTAAILELGLGFHPDFTGRENAVLYGGLVGIPEQVMRLQLTEILAFAELGEFIDQPVRTYSSGMVARLAFAVATHVDPRVLVVDEALAVGDGAFQRKCVDRMTAFRDQQRTVLFCSHSVYLISAFCDRVIWLRDGRVEDDGPPTTVIPRYEAFLRQKQDSQGGHERGARGENQLARVVSVAVLDRDGQRLDSLTPGRDVTIRAEIEVFEDGEDMQVAVAADGVGEGCIAGFSTLWDESRPLRGAGRWTVELVLPGAPFSRGEVEVAVFVMDAAALVIHSSFRTDPLTVDSPRWYPGPVLPPHRWEIRRE